MMQRQAKQHERNRNQTVGKAVYRQEPQLVLQMRVEVIITEACL